jgi:hypothetical protein
VHAPGDDAADPPAGAPRPGEPGPAGDAALGDVAAAAIAPHKPPRWAPLTLVAFVALLACSRAADIVWASWAEDHPAGLLALSSRHRYLVLAVAGGISPLSYAVIASLRLAAAFVVCHLIGRAYRETALSWFTRFLGVRPAQLEALNRGFAKAEIGLIPFFAGSNIVAVLTGVHRTRPAKLAILLAVGIAGRLALMWFLSKAFEEQLLDLLRFTGRYTVWLIVASVVVVVLVNVRNLRGGAR